jgi:hypothetical protein
VETKVARAFQRVKKGTNFLTIFMRWTAHATVAITHSRPQLHLQGFLAVQSKTRFAVLGLPRSG